MHPNRYEETNFGAARLTGGRHGYVAYFPRPIPRTIEVSPGCLVSLADAEAALGRLAGVARLLPDPHLLVQPYLRREALASTRIEGTQATLLEVYDAEATDAPYGADVEEVLNYVRAMQTGLTRLQSLPFSVRLIRELHAIILDGVRGRTRQPGEIRSSQNWIGGPDATVATATFVPPPPTEIGALLDDLERFVHEDPQLPALLQAALLHYQFETIHPFLDGNGRAGRLLIVFFLIVRQRIPSPVLYLSPYLESRRPQYYDALQAVRERGDIDTWLALFLDAVTTQATDAVARAERLVDLRERYRSVVGAATRGVAVQLVDVLFERPVLTARIVERRFDISRPAALKALRQLDDLGLIVATADGPRGQLRWRADELIGALTDTPA